MRGEDRFATIVDSDVLYISMPTVDESASCVTDKPAICLVHPAVTDMSEAAVIIRKDGLIVNSGPIGSDSDYEIRRVSTTQTVIKKRVTGIANLTITVGQQGVGFWAIGVNFVVS